MSMIFLSFLLYIRFSKVVYAKSISFQPNIVINESSFQNKEKGIPIAKQNFGATPPPTLDTDDDFFSLEPDVIFLLQRSGVSEEDFDNIKRFMTMVVGDLEKVSGSREDSRIGVALFTDVVRELLNFTSCCSGGKVSLQTRISELTMLPQFSLSRNRQGDYRSLSPYRINITTAFRSIRNQYLSGKKPKQKPKVVIFVANLQSHYASFRLILEAVGEIMGTKRTGAWLVVILVDPFDNRQPRILNDDLQLTHDLLQPSFNSIKKRNLESNDNYQNQQHRFERNSQLTNQQSKFLRRLQEAHKKESKAAMNYNQLARLYAQTLATRQDYGIKIQTYQDLLDPGLLQSIGKLLKDTTTWFGEGVIRTSCVETSNYLERIIWSPGFYTNGIYPDSITCRWRITARLGYRINLKFSQISVENTYDYIVVYDGFQEEPNQALGNYSGEFEETDLPDVSSTEEQMMVVFTSDAPGGIHRRGFRAIWNSIERGERIQDTQVVFVVDVSASIDKELFERPIKRYIKQLVKDFYLQEDIDKLSTNFNFGNTASELKPSKFGLISFDDRTKILRNISALASRRSVFNAVDQINFFFSDTYIGHALDYSRITQFLFLEGQTFPISSIAKEAQGRRSGATTAPKQKVLFLFTDAQSIDDPEMAAKRLCQNNIILVLIGTGRVNIKRMERLRSYCGIYFGINTPSSSVIVKLKEQFGIIPNMSFTNLPSLPSLRPFPNRTTLTTTISIPYIYIYTLPTMAPLPKKKLNYFVIAIILMITCGVEVLFWLGYICFETFYADSQLLRESDSKELHDAIFEGKYHPEPKAQDSFFKRHSVNAKNLDDFLKNKAIKET